MKDVKEDPVGKAKAFICNHAAHWFALRRFGSHWFNLNSLNDHPEYVSPMYLNLFLGQLRQEGYTIFVVTGNLPQCEADLLADFAFDVTEYNTQFKKKTTTTTNTGSRSPQDAELERVLRESLASSEDQELERVLRLSMQQQ
jgi:ataxin-3